MILLLLIFSSITIHWLAYKLYFKQHASIFFNRYFLLLSMVSSFAIPILGYYFAPIHTEELKLSEDVLTMLSSTNSTSALKEEVTQTIDFISIVWIAYFAVAAFLLLKVLYSVLKIMFEIKYSTLYKYKTFYYYHTERKIAPFSFFNVIVLNHNHMTENDLHCVLTHESIHIQQKHHYDLMLSELVCIVLWFFPICYFLKKYVKENLEYITDYKSVQIHDKKQYQNTLLRIVAPQYKLEMATHFNKQMLKNRILMMNKPNTRMSKWNLILFPVLLTILAATSLKAQEKTETKIVVITNDKDVKKDDVHIEITKNGTKQKVHSDDIELVTSTETDGNVKVISSDKTYDFKSLDGDSLITKKYYFKKENDGDLEKISLTIHKSELNANESIDKQLEELAEKQLKSINLSRRETEKLKKELKNSIDKKEFEKLSTYIDSKFSNILFEFKDSNDEKSQAFSFTLNELDFVQNDEKNATKIFLNGKEISPKEINEISSENITFMKITKGTKIPKEYKSKMGNSNTLILIKTN